MHYHRWAKNLCHTKKYTLLLKRAHVHSCLYMYILLHLTPRLFHGLFSQKNVNSEVWTKSFRSRLVPKSIISFNECYSKKNCPIFSFFLFLFFFTKIRCTCIWFSSILWCSGLYCFTTTMLYMLHNPGEKILNFLGVPQKEIVPCLDDPPLVHTPKPVMFKHLFMIFKVDQTRSNSCENAV